MARLEETNSQKDFSPARLIRLAGLLAIIIALSPAAPAQTLTALYSFTGGQDGSAPIAGVTMDGAGNLYGTTYQGGANGDGVVYKLTHRGSAWVFSALYSFQGGDDGAAPIGGVTIGSDGALYGTTSGGGQHGKGVIYKLSPQPTICRSTRCPWIETVLHQFTGGPDGYGSTAQLIFDSAGNLYGTAGAGGTGNNGVVFKLTHSGAVWTETVLYSFGVAPDGSGPISGVIFDGNGNLYGTTNAGGAGLGTVYELSPSGAGWTEKILYAFQSINDGEGPRAGVTLDPNGNLYGATYSGGSGNGGTIFELTPSNGNWTFSVLYNPLLEGLGGPVGTLARSSSGTLYGTLLSGGLTQDCQGYGCGSVFQLSPSNGGWVYTSLYEFTGGADGSNPEGWLILDSSGNLYGTTTGSLSGSGSVFELTP